jgi:hypothetical protein
MTDTNPRTLDLRTIGTLVALGCSIVALLGQFSQLYVYAHRVNVLEDEVRALRMKSDTQSATLSRIEAMVSDLRDRFREGRSATAASF